MNTEITAIFEWFYLYRVVSEYAKRICSARRIRLKPLNVLGENANNILPYTDITPVDINLSLSVQIFVKKTEKKGLIDYRQLIRESVPSMSYMIF